MPLRDLLCKGCGTVKEDFYFSNDKDIGDYKCEKCGKSDFEKVMPRTSFVMK